MSWVTGEACLCVLRWQLWRRSERRRNIEKWHVIKEKKKKTEKWHATARMEVQKKMTIDNKLRWKVSGWCDFGLVQTCFQPRSADGSGWLRRPGPERGPTGNALSHLECCDGASLYPGRFPLAVLVPSWSRPVPAQASTPFNHSPSLILCNGGYWLLIGSPPMERTSWHPSCATVVARRPWHMNFWAVRMFRIGLYILYRALGVIACVTFLFSLVLFDVCFLIINVCFTCAACACLSLVCRNSWHL